MGVSHVSRAVYHHHGLLDFTEAKLFESRLFVLRLQVRANKQTLSYLGRCARKKSAIMWFASIDSGSSE